MARKGRKVDARYSCPDCGYSWGGCVCAARAAARENQKTRFNMNTGKNDVYFGTEKLEKGDGHGHAILDGDGNKRYVRGVYDANKPGDREDAIVYDDKDYLG